MEPESIIKATKATERLIQDSDYYKYIFKKTEKIVSVVFYITHNLTNDSKTGFYVEDIEKSARAVHDAILGSLEVRAHVAEEAVRAGAHALVTLDSKLRVAQTTGLITPDVLQVFVNEIDAVLRGMNKYIDGIVIGGDLTARNPVPVSTPRRTTAGGQSAAPAANASDAKPHRRDRIKTVLEAKGEASIKDIVEIVSDVSEKTIQRELNAMIKDNEVKRQGERRWSKYSMF